MDIQAFIKALEKILADKKQVDIKIIAERKDNYEKNGRD